MKLKFDFSFVLSSILGTLFLALIRYLFGFEIAILYAVTVASMYLSNIERKIK